jgi:hypothetical protein
VVIKLLFGDSIRSKLERFELGKHLWTGANVVKLSGAAIY